MNIKRKTTCIFIVFFLLFFFFVFLNVAEDCIAREDVEEQDEVALEDPLGMGGEEDAPQVFIGRIINASLGVVGSLALLMFVYGGFIWMLAAGNSEKVEKGKNILFWATVGLVVIFTSYVIVNFVIFELIGAPGGGG